jgi:hypothetical protein
MKKHLLIALITYALVSMTGCSTIVQKASDRVANQLQQAILNNNDPATVGDAMPAYLLLLDALIAGQKPGEPSNAGTLFAASKLYSAYAGNFVRNDPERSKRLSKKAFDYARTAVCLTEKELCESLDKDVDGFSRVVVDVRNADALYALASSWISYLQANSDDWGAIADLPKIEQLFLRVVELDQQYDSGQAYVYLGVLNCLRPEAVGGKPEQGRKFFEYAIELSSGKNLYAKTLMAEYYARLLFNQELHDKLLNEVIAADPQSDKFTLINSLAQERAKQLLESGKDYF